MKLTLLSTDTALPAYQITLRGTPVRLGRSGPGIRLDDPRVSHFHCTLVEIAGNVVVRDLGSQWGTLVNGSLVTEAVLLPGDTLTLGGSSFRAEYRSRAPLRRRRQVA